MTKKESGLVSCFRRVSPTPIAIGTGLLTLDIVISSNVRRAPRLYAGGTCGNVLCILRYLGWRSFPVARLNGDAASNRVLSDLKAWGVGTRFAQLSPKASTPIIVHQISKNRRGHPSHRFTWACPQCGAWLPTYQAVTASAVNKMAPDIGSTQIFFMDRISRGALLLAEACARKGALVVFEPVGIGDPKLFREALTRTHILKYAHEKRPAFAGLIDEVDRPLLEIETRGSAGLRYRSRLPFSAGSQWRSSTAFKVPHFRDAAGAGDWCTAGLIHILGQRGVAGFVETSPVELEAAMRFGQAMAAWTCSFEGAREGMYAAPKATFRSAILNLLSVSNDKKELTESVSLSRVTLRRATPICPRCERPSHLSRAL